MHPCRADIIAQIRGQGPISVGEFMHAALGGKHGYYTNAPTPLGRCGDFTTAPEISQCFGELLGLWAAYQWQDLVLDIGYKGPLHLVELGPGRGTLMADALRAIGKTKPKQTPEIHLCEINPHLRTAQQSLLAGHAVNWIDDLNALPQKPCIIIANEFFDALPIEQAVYHLGEWRERCIDYQAAEDRFFFTPGALLSPNLRPPQNATPGAVWEYAPARAAAMRLTAQHVAKYGGAIAILDYGYLQPGLGDTLQALRRHSSVEALSQPGQADLTAHVDFHALGQSAHQARLRIEFCGTQGDFLSGLGIEQRARQLVENATPAQAEQIITSVQRLIEPAQMGELFKALTLRSLKML